MSFLGLDQLSVFPLPYTIILLFCSSRDFVPALTVENGTLFGSDRIR